MILTRLYDYYRRVSGSDPDAPPPPGFAVQKVVGAVQIGLDGRFLGLVPLNDTDAKGKSRPRLMVVPQPPSRTVAISAAFLCDNGGYLLGIDLKGKPERARLQFAASAARHREILAGVDDPGARAVLAFFANWNPAGAAGILAGQEELLQGWLVFLLAGEAGYLHDRPAVKAAWLRHISAAAAESTGQCLVTGEEAVAIARLHPPIKSVPGAQSAGASLVSFNFDAAESYGKSQSFNAPVSEAAAFGYGAALNHLLRRETNRSRTVGDTTFVFWADRPCPQEDLLIQLIDPADLDPGEDAPAEDRHRAAEVRDALMHLREGVLPPSIEQSSQVGFYVLGLSPNAARLSVRLWLETTLGALARNIGEHQRDLALVVDRPHRPQFPTLWSLVLDTRPKDADGKARGRADNDKLFKMHGELLRAALTGLPYPAMLLPVLLARFRSDGHLTHPRVALLKALVNRRWRTEEPERKELLMALDTSRRETGYLLGRLFAALERLQEAAQGGDLNRSIRDKFVGAAAATPRSAFNHLLPLSEAHRRKARRDNRGGAVQADRIISQVMGDLAEIPAVMAADDQALFFLGYYQQRQDFFTKRSDADAVAETV